MGATHGIGLGQERNWLDTKIDISGEDWVAVSLFSMQPSTHAVDDKHTTEQQEISPLATGLLRNLGREKTTT